MSDEEAFLVPEPEDETVEASEPEGSTHTEIQDLLTKLGADMGFDVHLARTDATVNGKVSV